MKRTAVFCQMETCYPCTFFLLTTIVLLGKLRKNVLPEKTEGSNTADKVLNVLQLLIVNTLTLLIVKVHDLTENFCLKHRDFCPSTYTQVFFTVSLGKDN